MQLCCAVTRATIATHQDCRAKVLAVHLSGTQPPTPAHPAPPYAHCMLPHATLTHLEGQSEVLAVRIHSLLVVLVHLAEHSTAATAGGNQAGRLVKRLVEVLLQRHLRVKQAARLADLSVGKVSNDPGDELDDLLAQAAAAAAGQTSRHSTAEGSTAGGSTVR